MELRHFLAAWDEPMRDAGQDVYTIVAGDLKQIARDHLARVESEEPHHIRNAALERELTAMQKVLTGEMDAAYVAHRQAQVSGLAAKGVTQVEATLLYRDYHGAIMESLVRRSSWYLGLQPEQSQAFLLALNCENAVMVEAYLALENARQEEAREALIDGLAQSIGQVVSAAGDGDLSARVETRFEDPRLDAVAQHLDAFITVVEQVVDESSQAVRALAAGDLSARVDGAGGGAFAEMRESLNLSMGRFAHMVSDIVAAAGEFQTSAVELGQRARDMQVGAGPQAARLGKVDGDMRALSETLEATMTRASGLSARIEEAGQVEAAARRDMSAMQDSIAGVADGFDEISKLMQVIDDIAMQTSLLSLNASVEAARAGEAGSGFAVVASEVRKLAEHVTEAASQVRQLTGANAARVTESAEQARSAHGSVEALVEIVGELSRALGTIAEEAGGQHRSVGALEQLLSGVAATAREVSGISARVEETAGRLEQVAGELRQGVAIFDTTPASVLAAE